MRITKRQLRRIINENLGDSDTHIQDGIQTLMDAEEKFYYAYDIMERQEDPRLAMLDDELEKLRNFIATMAQNLRVS